MGERCTASATIVDDSVSGGIPSNVRKRSMFEQGRDEGYACSYLVKECAEMDHLTLQPRMNRGKASVLAVCVEHTGVPPLEPCKSVRSCCFWRQRGDGLPGERQIATY